MLNLLLQPLTSYLVLIQFTLSSFHVSNKSKNWLAANVWVIIAQLVKHCSNFVKVSGGHAFVECPSVKCRWNISSCLKTTFLDSNQPLHAVIDFNLRLRILVTRFRISRLCALSFENLYRHTWGEAIFDKSRPMTQQIKKRKKEKKTSKSILIVKQVMCAPNQNMTFVTCQPLDESMGIFGFNA